VPGAGAPRPVRCALVLLGVVLVVATSCARTSESVELAEDPADVTVPGPPPTAPPRDESTSGISGATRLISDLEALQRADDLCEVLTGDAFARLVAQDPDATGLVTSPAGVTQLVALLERTFDHLVGIAPAEVRGDMGTVRDVWLRIVALGPAPDAARRAEELVAAPEVVGAVQRLALWTATNCAGVPIAAR
jgi:hypothetical protein